MGQNGSNSDYGVSLLQQKVPNYSGTSINFSWAAVLEASHGANDSDEFTMVVDDNTLGTNCIDVAVVLQHAPCHAIILIPAVDALPDLISSTLVGSYVDLAKSPNG